MARPSGDAVAQLARAVRLREEGDRAEARELLVELSERGLAELGAVGRYRPAVEYYADNLDETVA